MRRKRLQFFIAAGALAVLLGGSGSGRDIRTAYAFHGTPIQQFRVDVVECLSLAPLPNLDDPTLPLSCSAPENKSTSAAPEVTSIHAAPAGSRLPEFMSSYLGPGWVAASSASIPDDTIIASDYEVLDLYCDGVLDVIAAGVVQTGGFSALSAHRVVQVSEFQITVNALRKQAQFNAKAQKVIRILKKLNFYQNLADFFVGIENKDKAFLDKLLLLQLPNVKINVSLEIDPDAFIPFWIPYKFPWKYVIWKTPKPIGDPLPSLICLDTPLVVTRIDESASGARANPANAGLYTRWSLLVSERDVHEGIRNVVLVTNCKAIGSAFTDADADCLATVSNPGGPADSNDVNPDQDGDGLLDGIEAAFGSASVDADTDNDGRSDFEEIISTDALPSHPGAADSDNDGVTDGGFCVDSGNDGAPDEPDANGDNVLGDLHGTASTQADGSSHRSSGARLVECAPGSHSEEDNCPTIANPLQANFDAAMPNGDHLGDACDDDIDQDRLLDYNELEDFYWDPVDRCQEDGNAADIAHGGAPDDDVWVDQFGTPHAVTAPLLSVSNPDTDSDGYLDGVECLLGANPTSAASTPPFPAVGDTDGDGLNANQERFFRTGSFSGTISEDVDGDDTAGTCSTTIPPSCGFIDSDSDGDGLEDRMEAAVLGTSPISRDSDGDGIEDQDETFPGSSCGLIAYGNAAIKLFSGRMGFEDTTVPWSAKTSPTDCSGLTDNDGDGLPDAGESTGANCGGIATTPGNVSLDVTYDDDQDGNPRTGSFGGSDPTDDAVPWDTDGDGQLDGAECNPPGGGTPSNPTLSASKLTAVQCGPVGDADVDGLDDRWENCKWGTNPANSNTDGVAPGDCKEALDVDGNNVINSTGDFVQHARAAFTSGTFGKDGIYDIDGNNVINSTGDFVAAAKRIFLQLPCL